MIRRSTPEDAVDLARMGEAFFRETPLSSFTTFDPASLFRLITSTDSVATFVCEQDGKVCGAASCVVYPLAFNNNVLVGQELFWWVDEDSRKSTAGRDLNKAIIDWSKEMGASLMIMVAIENPSVSKVKKIYNHYGYTALEHAFIKEV